jgi:tRNAThr (cytosine32-N3)-methyltransferase
MTVYQRARFLIDAVHEADPVRTPEGDAAELLYADRMEAWLRRLTPTANEALCLAARCQHLQRWSVPRTEFAAGRAGYHAWRTSLYRLQAQQARSLLLEAGVPTAEADAVAAWVAKADIKHNPGSQALEDAAILVFLDSEIEGFAAKHSDYSEARFIDILRKTWRKLSANGREAALGLQPAPGIAALLAAAIAVAAPLPPEATPTERTNDPHQK